MRRAAIAAFLAVASAVSAQQAVASAEQAAVSAPQGAVSAQQGVPKELTALQGTWVVVTVNGESVAARGVAADITFTGDKYAASINGTISERGTIKVDASKKPMTIDFFITEGQPIDVNKTQLGIMEIEADTLRIHLNRAGEATRPADFQPLRRHDLVVLKKKT